MTSGINEAYINSLPTLNGKPKVSLDLNCFEKFDTKRKGVSISFSTRNINIIGDTELPDRIRIHINASASIVVLIGDAENGFEVRQIRGHRCKSGYRCLVGASAVSHFLTEKGVTLPVEAKLNYDGELGGWVARLPMQEGTK